MGKNILYVKPKVKINRSRNNGAIIRIDSEAADILEQYINKVEISVSQLASNFIKYAADNTIIKDSKEEEGNE